ncbi:ABC transporter ATP-binding protein [Devosia nitrariae]|uniref:Oligopeptide ABC transporter ATP-binding protein OppF n=1 Tax=Devosia nitrariae TaxID=2071872 RepID=A0ABQ5W9S7_9HYPH|nr:ABC transporter ATP-binding protein [Devosia nitrariae]GLQ56534.1 oligopeptide ABC transporter ATP-binding protein OppF [Devosia nitrariae]
MAANLLEVRNLGTTFRFGQAEVQALHEVSFEARTGRVLGIVGESGSGKSLTARAIMRMLPETASVSNGEVLFESGNLLDLPEARMRSIRGSKIAMVFQDPQAALNPVKTVGWQIEEALVVHGMNKSRARARAIELLGQVGIPEPDKRIDDFPHQFSGGMRQRVVIAIAIANSAKLIIADEPTTALDVTIQAQVLRLLVDLKSRLDIGVILITHDMGVVAEICDDIVVMYGGRVVERGAVAGVFAAPQHPYTRNLLRSMPRIEGVRTARLPTIPGSTPDLSRLPSGCAFHPRCQFAEDICLREVPVLLPMAGSPEREAACHVARQNAGLPPDPDPTPSSEPLAGVRTSGSAPAILEIEDLSVTFPGGGGWLRREKPIVAVDGVSLSLRPGETLGLVGESGCGKTSLSRTIVGLNRPSSGYIRVAGEDVTDFGAEAAAHVRRTVQYVFQDPYASLNPRLSIRQILSEALEQRGLPGRQREAAARALMDMVGLDAAYLDRYPKAFSGGQRQRIGIARALAVEPRVLICDEPVSALDVSIQAQVINILADLRDRLGLGILFIAHDLSVVRHLSDRVAVMYLGRIVEIGPASDVYEHPLHPYTAVLLSSTPKPVPDPSAMQRKLVLGGDMPSPRNPPSGCRFRTRCPIGPLADPSRRICIEKDPLLVGPGEHKSACHFPDEAAGLAVQSKA